MENPFKVLKIEENKNFDEILEYFEQKLIRLRSAHGVCSNIFDRYKSSGIKYVTSAAIRKESENDILDFLNERFVFGLVADRKYCTQTDADNIIIGAKQRIEEMQNYLQYKDELASKPKTAETSTEAVSEIFIDLDLEKRAFSSIMSMARNIIGELKSLSEYLEKYKSNPEDIAAREALVNLYIKEKFEESVCELASQKQAELQPEIKAAEQVYDNNQFKIQLQNSPEYMRLLESYNRVSTAQARADLKPELYVLSRIAQSSRVGAISEKRANSIVEAEQQYQDEYSSNLLNAFNNNDFSSYATNANHDFAWGMILTNPQNVMKNEPVDTPIFKGTMSVEHLGAFTEESFFKKVKMKKKLKEDSKPDRTIRGISRTILKKLREPFPIDFDDGDKSKKIEAGKAKTIMEYYRYKSTKTVFDNIYRVTKTDVDGKTTTDIVFSPLAIKDFEDNDTRTFIKNIYFSDYMLDIAKTNGGYAGEIYPSQKGFAIDTKTMSEKIGAAILFSRGMKGTIFDTRADNEKSSKAQIKDVILSSNHTLASTPVSDKVNKYRNATNKIFKELLKGKERERSIDE